MNARYISACTGKEAFPERSLARKVANRMRRRNRNSRAAEYHCKCCGQWHVGTAVAPHTKMNTRSHVELREFWARAQAPSVN